MTYPRTGYVSFRQPTKSRRAVTMIIALIVSGAVVSILMLLPGSLDWIPLIDGAAVGIFLSYQGQSFNLSRFYSLALLAAALGVGLSVAGIGNLVAMLSSVESIEVVLILATMARFKPNRLILD